MPVLIESPNGYTLTTNDFKTIKTHTFQSTDTALHNMLTLSRGELPQDLHAFLQGFSDSLVVGDKRLAALIPGAAFDLETYRLARVQVAFAPSAHMAHQMSSETVGKFDNTDAVLVRTYKALEDLDANINLQCMRIREWYGFHFPELAHIIADNQTYLRTVIAIPSKDRISDEGLKGVVGEETVKRITEAAKISVGSEMTHDDIEKIQVVSKSVVREFEFKNELTAFITEGVRTAMPNTCSLVQCELLVCRLLAHAGSLSVLAKVPASTIQIYGAEKAYFGAVKTKGNTPKYGLIYHAPTVMDSVQKGKVARILATLICLAVKVDYYGTDKGFGDELRTRLLKRVEAVERSKKGTKKVLKIGKHEFNNSKKYDAGMDGRKRVKRD